MRILAYTEVYASETVTFITNELRLLQDQHEVMLVYSVRKNPDRYQLRRMVEIPYMYNRFVNKIRWWLERSGLIYIASNPSFRRRLNKVIEEFRPQLIHCHFGTDYLKVAANINRRYTSLPILISFYGFDVNERLQWASLRRAYKKRLSRKTVHSIAVSGTLVEKVNSRLQPANPARLVHSGIDTDLFKRRDYEPKDRPFTFLQVASFNPKKGHLSAIRAYGEFIKREKEPKSKFIIAGFGPLESEIRLLIMELGLEDRIEIRGPVTPSGMVELASNCDCFVHMSVTAPNGDQEGLPNVILEAMSLELPVLSTYHAGIPEIITNGVHGILCRENDLHGYVQGFEEIRQWPLCSINRQRVIEHFSVHAHMTELNHIYSEILELAC